MKHAISLFHLHFYINDLELYEDFFVTKLGMPIKGRFSKDTGQLPPDISWKQILADQIKLRLVELERGGVNIVLMPGRWEKPRLEHFGLILPPEQFSNVLERTRELGLKIKENPKRTFLSTKLGFRIEIHCDETKEMSNSKKVQQFFLANLSFATEKPVEFKRLFHQLFDLDFKDQRLTFPGDPTSTLTIEEGDFNLPAFSIQGKDFERQSISASDIPVGLPLTTN